MKLQTIALTALYTFMRRSIPTYAFSTATNKAAKGQSEVAIKAAKDFTVSQRQKLKDLGALDIQRPIKITAEAIVDGSSSSDSKSNVVTKTIHFQRHGQGFHNLICDIWREKGLPIDFDSQDPSLNPVIRNEFLDPPLTENGRQQCKDRREQCSTLNPELVIVSPLLRCIQTAQLSFRDHTPQVRDIPWIAHEGCREELGLLTGNKRRAKDEIEFEFPFIDFSLLEHEDDVLWDEYGDRRETLLEKSERIYDFLVNFVMDRPEKDIAIVSHSAYLFTLLNAVMDIDDEDLRFWFLTSEVRSMQVTFQTNDEYKK